MDSFDKIFAQDVVDDLALDVQFSDKEDGELIDIVAASKLFTENGNEIENPDLPETDDNDEEELSKEEACYFKGNEFTSTDNREYDYPVHEEEPETTSDLDRKMNDCPDCVDTSDSEYNDFSDDVDEKCHENIETTSDLDKEMGVDPEGNHSDDEDIDDVAGIESECRESAIDNVATTSDLDNVMNNTGDESPEEELEDLDGDEDIDDVAGLKESYGLDLL